MEQEAGNKGRISQMADGQKQRHRERVAWQSALGGVVAALLVCFVVVSRFPREAAASPQMERAVAMLQQCTAERNEPKTVRFAVEMDWYEVVSIVLMFVIDVLLIASNWMAFQWGKPGKGQESADIGNEQSLQQKFHSWWQGDSVGAEWSGCSPCGLGCGVWPCCSEVCCLG